MGAGEFLAGLTESGVNYYLHQKTQERQREDDARKTRLSVYSNILGDDNITPDERTHVFDMISNELGLKGKDKDAFGQLHNVGSMLGQMLGQQDAPAPVASAAPDPASVERPRRASDLGGVNAVQPHAATSTPATPASNPSMEQWTAARQMLGLANRTLSIKEVKQVRDLAAKLGFEGFQASLKQQGAEADYWRDIDKLMLQGWHDDGVRYSADGTQPVRVFTNPRRQEQHEMPVPASMARSERDVESEREDGRVTTRPVRTAGAWVAAESSTDPNIKAGATRQRRTRELTDARTQASATSLLRPPTGGTVTAKDELQDYREDRKGAIGEMRRFTEIEAEARKLQSAADAQVRAGDSNAAQFYREQANAKWSELRQQWATLRDSYPEHVEATVNGNSLAVKLRPLQRRRAPLAALPPVPTDPRIKAYADKYFGGDYAAAQRAIEAQRRGR